MTLEERFWTKVDKNGPNGCWLWTAGKGCKGYGTFHIGGKVYGAHRVAWELENGSIPEGLCVLHRCDVKLCVNQEHLFIGTNNNNIADATKKGRRLNGEKIGDSKLTTKDVIQIRVLAGTMSQREIGEIFGVSDVQISNIINYKSWRHVQ